MASTRIEWADAVWNPITGCSKVSAGCKHCYAERMTLRLQAMGQPHYANGFQVTLHPDALEIPLKWKKPRRIFVNSMSDPFHEDVPFDFVERVWDVMYNASQHTYMILTKRPERMLEFFRSPVYQPLPHVWLGVSAENQRYADERIPLLLQTPAVVRFVSLEPLLGPIDLVQGMHGGPITEPTAPVGRIDWTIVGGESGPGARPMHPDWARSIRDQCGATGVPFFFKQWGESIPRGQIMTNGIESFLFAAGCEAFGGTAPKRSIEWDEKNWAYRVGKKRAGRLLDGRTWDEMPGGVSCYTPSTSA